jgi:predicted Holliday junction resolvase-like endonuclease
MEEVLRTVFIIFFLIVIPVGIVSLLYKIISIKRDIKREEREWNEYLKEIELGH